MYSVVSNRREDFTNKPLFDVLNTNKRIITTYYSHWRADNLVRYLNTPEFYAFK